MPNQLSYQSLRCVLEHLEANKRISISCRCPVLRKIEKTIPLHLDKLVLGDFRIALNKISFCIQTVTQIHRKMDDKETLFYSVDDYGRPNKSELLPGDIRLGDINVWPLEDHDRKLFNRYVEISFKHGSDHQEIEDLCTDCERYIPNMEFHEAMKTLTQFLLGGRREIRVKQLEIEPYRENILRLPLNLKIQVETIVFIEEQVFEAISHLIDASRPLKELEIWVQNSECFQNRVFQISEKLILYDDQDFDVSLLFNLPNKNVELLGTKLTQEDLIRLIRHWMNTGRVIGTCYKFDCSGREFVEVLLDGVKKQFNGVSVKLKEHDKKSPTSLLCVSVPMNSGSELLIYETYDCTVQMEVCRIGSTEPIGKEPKLSFKEHLNKVTDELPTCSDFLILVIVLYFLTVEAITVVNFLIELL